MSIRSMLDSEENIRRFVESNEGVIFCDDDAVQLVRDAILEVSHIKDADRECLRADKNATMYHVWSCAKSATLDDVDVLIKAAGDLKVERMRSESILALIHISRGKNGHNVAQSLHLLGDNPLRSVLRANIIAFGSTHGPHGVASAVAFLRTCEFMEGQVIVESINSIGGPIGSGFSSYIADEINSRVDGICFLNIVRMLENISQPTQYLKDAVSDAISPDSSYGRSDRATIISFAAKNRGFREVIEPLLLRDDLRGDEVAAVCLLFSKI